MKTSDRTLYRLGIRIVVGTVLASLAVCLAVGVIAASDPARAAGASTVLGYPLGSFRLQERSGREVTNVDLEGRVWVASFIFTRCPLSCPKISSIMKGLQGKFAGSGVRLVSISVDPEHDTPAVLADYARRFGAEGDRWWFLTGPKSDVYELIRGRFKLGLAALPPDAVSAGAEEVTHSSRLVLVEGNRVLRTFDSSDTRDVQDLIVEARRLDAGHAAPWVLRLPAVNAGLNASCALLLALAWTLIRTGNPRGHAATMTAAVVVSGLFLACYLVYHAHVGSVPFQGQGPVRLLYFTILLSHTILATFGVVPLVTWTLINAVRKRFDRHARVASVTFPIWMYVSVTGVVIYVMLYQMPIGSPTPL